MKPHKYQVILESKAHRELLDLPKDVVKHIANILDHLGHTPRPVGAKKLRGQNGYRIRKGCYRILYTVNDNNQEIIVFRIGHRRDIYR